MHNIIISIVSHQQFSLIRLLLDDLRKQNINDYCKIILTSNTPEDLSGLVDYEDLPIKLVCNESPRGFGENHNRAYDYFKSDVFLVVNPDIRLDMQNFNLSEFVLSSFKVDSKIVAPMVIDAAGVVDQNYRKYPKFLNMVVRYLGGKYEYEYPEVLLESSGDFSVDWVGGMFMLFKSDAYRDLGGFDVKYFMYMEDVDICRRSEILHKTPSLLMARFKVTHNAQRDSRRKLRNLIWHIKSALLYFYREKIGGFKVESHNLNNLS